MNAHEQDIHRKLETYSEYGRASLLFQGIVTTDTRETIRYSDDLRITHFQQKYAYQLSDNVVGFVRQQLSKHRKERLFCVYRNGDRDAVITAVTNEIFRRYRQDKGSLVSDSKEHS